MDRWFIDEYTNLFPGSKPCAPADSPFRQVDRKFVIAFTPRVGSTLLCQHLFNYGVFVAEFFNPEHLQAATHVEGATDYQDLCRRLVARYAVGDAWGLKAHIQSTIPLFLVGEFPAHIGDWRFVYLNRENVVRQAISQVIAERRHSWASWVEPANEISDDEYSHDEIAKLIWSTKLSQASWEKFFELFGIEPLRISYEQIVADPEVAARRLADHCGLEPGGKELVAQFDDPPLKSQLTALNAAWEQRFLREQAAGGG